MKKTIFLFLMALGAKGLYSQEIYSAHFFLGRPQQAVVSESLIFRDLYVLSNNPQTKFANWVAYQITPEDVWSRVDVERRWRKDPLLPAEQTLEPNPDDYKGAYAQHKYQRGHLVPLAAFKGSETSYELNYYSNIAPQTASLNTGVWKDLESAVREMVQSGKTLWVMTGPYYLENQPMPSLPSADESHLVPNGYWKIICSWDQRRPQVAAYLFPQNVPSHQDFSTYNVSVDDIEKITALDFFNQLHEEEEIQLEALVSSLASLSQP